MKSYQIIVNGKTYDIDVIPKSGSGAQPAKPQPMMERTAAPAPAPAKPQAAAPTAPTAPAEKPKAAAGQTVITAPLPGVVNAVNCKVGDKVEPSTVLFVVEAMKMENEIFAGVAGTVLEVSAAKGQMLDTDAKMAVIG